MQKHKSFRQFSEQAVAAAAKPKVSDPSTGVDIDDKGRWEGQIVGKGKEIKPKEVVKVKDGVKGPDPNLPAGSANPNTQIAGLSAQERKELMMLRKGLIKGDFGTGPDKTIYPFWLVTTSISALVYLYFIVKNGEFV